MAYATVADLRGLLGASRTAQCLPGGLTTEAEDALLLRALEAAAGIMDSTFLLADYPAPVDPGGAGDYEATLRSLLESRNIDLALGELTFGLDAKPEFAEQAVRRSDVWRHRLIGVKDPVTGARLLSLEILPGLARTGGVLRRTTAWPIQTEDLGEDHPFTPGAPMARVSGAWELADASDESHLCTALCTAVSGSTVEYAILSAGVVTIPDHGLVGDASGWLYLGAGELVGVKPEAGWRQRVALVKDSSHLILVQEPALWV